jgi:hypothetical protein
MFIGEHRTRADLARSSADAKTLELEAEQVPSFFLEIGYSILPTVDAI